MCPSALSTERVAKVRTCGDPGTRVGVDFFGDGEGPVEELDRLREVVEVVEDNGQFVEEERVGFAELVRSIEVLLGESHIIELKVLHPKEELWEVRSLEQARGGAVCGDGLVMLAFCGKGVSEADPCGAKMRVHHRCFREETASFGNLVDGKIVDPHGKPGYRFIGVEVGEPVGEEEKRVCLVELVQAGEVKGVDGEVVFIGVEDGGSDGEGLFKPALGEEEFGF